MAGTLEALARENLLKPFGDLDPLFYYSLVSRKLVKYLHGKEIAGKNLVPQVSKPLLKRGSELPPLWIEDLCDYNELAPEFFELRKGHLQETRKKLTPKQELVWRYFFPRKLSEMLYATNNETPGRPIERIFFDLDRGEGITQEQARQAALALVETIKDDKDFSVKHDLAVFWTGNSFHVFLLLHEPIPASDYLKLFQYSMSSPTATFTGKWAKKIGENFSFKVAGGHEKKKGTLVLDPSQTPSGKLARAPFSLHVSKDWKEIDGVDVPLNEKDLSDESLVSELRALTPQKVYEKLDFHASKLPVRLRV